MSFLFVEIVRRLRTALHKDEHEQFFQEAQ